MAFGFGVLVLPFPFPFFEFADAVGMGKSDGVNGAGVAGVAAAEPAPSVNGFLGVIAAKDEKAVEDGAAAGLVPVPPYLNVM